MNPDEEGGGVVRVSPVCFGKQIILLIPAFKAKNDKELPPPFFSDLGRGTERICRSDRIFFFFLYPFRELSRKLLLA